MPRRSVRNWSALSKATERLWRSFAFLAKKRNRRGPSTESVSSWLKRARSWKPRDAVSWSITGWNRSSNGGRVVPLPSSGVPEWMKELLSQSQPILLLLEEKIHALTLQLQAGADPKQPRGLEL